MLDVMGRNDTHFWAEKFHSFRVLSWPKEEALADLVNKLNMKKKILFAGVELYFS